MGCRFRYFIITTAELPQLCRSFRSKVFYDPGPSVPQNRCNSGSLVNFQALRSYARDARKGYNLFGRGRPGDEEFKKTWAKEMDEDNNTLWTGSEDESDEDTGPKTDLDKEIRKARLEAKKHADLIDADDSHELRSVWSGSDEEKTLWTGDEMDSDDDIPTEAYPSESSDQYIDNCLSLMKCPNTEPSQMLKAEQEPEELHQESKLGRLLLRML
ncbi:hypothetical protein JHK87_040227 [Glycine soja]|nr:hypothetical protein JHK87_040227 [Glycine soja]